MGGRSILVEQAVGAGPLGDFAAGVEAELVVDIGDMVLHGALGDEELAGDIGVRELDQPEKIRLGLRKLVRWLHDETGRTATLRELNLLNDHCLDDIGRRRPLDPKTDDLVKLLRAGG